MAWTHLTCQSISFIIHAGQKITRILFDWQIDKLSTCLTANKLSAILKGVICFTKMLPSQLYPPTKPLQPHPIAAVKVTWKINNFYLAFCCFLRASSTLVFTSAGTSLGQYWMAPVMTWNSAPEKSCLVVSFSVPTEATKPPWRPLMSCA